jgi:transcriptional regulator GlxA family with amidase domain
MADRYPNVDVDPNPIFVKDGNRYTSAGVTAGIDLALALVEEDYGPALALQIARSIVVYLRRPGGQSQFSLVLSLQASDRTQLRDLQSWVIENLRSNLTVERLAEKAGMSPRNFARVFTQQLGITPKRFIEKLRVEAARRRLEEEAGNVSEVATQCGFRTTESMRMAFQRSLRVSPADYRKRFQKSVAP